MPSSRSSCAVPPVETISTPSSARPRAKSTRPRLSDTDSSARRTWTSPASVPPVPLCSVASAIVDQYDAGIVGVEPDRPGCDQPHRPRQEPVLDLVDPLLDRGDVARIRKLEGLLQDDRPAVDALVDEVDGHSPDPHAVLDRLLDRPYAGERRQQRGVHVDDPSLEATDELGPEDLHEAREHQQVDLALVEPVAHRLVARRPVPVRGDLERGGLDAGRGGPLE